MTHDINWYIDQIGNMSNKFGDKLLLLLNENDKNCLRDITYEQAKAFYEKLVNEDK